MVFVCNFRVIELGVVLGFFFFKVLSLGVNGRFVFGLR